MLPRLLVIDVLCSYITQTREAGLHRLFVRIKHAAEHDGEEESHTGTI